MEVLAGGEAVGPCYQATVITDVPADSDFAKHETFGPVLAVEIVDSADEAIMRANDTTYGLSAGILTSDADRGMALAQRLESGIVHINDQPVGDEPQMPFGGVKATDNVTLDFADGSLTAVIGPNGAGKSTFFNLVTGALKPDAGQILLNGVDLAGRTPPDIVRHGIGRAFQVASIFPSLTVHETMLAAVCADQRRAVASDLGA